MTEGPRGPELDGILRRVATLEAERGVLQTLYRYAHTIDYGLEEEWVDCFVEDAVYDVQIVAPTAVPLSPFRHVGHSALRAFVAAHTNAPAAWHKHLLFEPMVQVDGARASATSYFLRLDADLDGRPYARAFGRYVDRLAMGADGRWRFEERVAEVEGAWRPA